VLGVKECIADTAIWGAQTSMVISVGEKTIDITFQNYQIKWKMELLLQFVQHNLLHLLRKELMKAYINDNNLKHMFNN
jgi:hypothetical protein